MILVTGGTGLVGAHILLSLTENNTRIRAIYRTEKNIQKTKQLFKTHHKLQLFKNIEWVPADIIDIITLENAFKDITYVYHCAAHISFDPDEEDLLRKINIEGTANIVNFCLHYNIKKLCYVSSIAALGHSKNKKEIITETTEWNSELAYDHYAISKYGAEIEIWRGQREGLATVIVNPGIIIGSGFWNQGSGVLFTTINKGLSFYAKGQTAYTDINDLVTIMLSLMQQPISGERFIVINENCSYQNVCKLVAENLGLTISWKKAPLWLLKLFRYYCWIANLLGFKKYIFSKSMYQAAISTKTYSNDTIVKTLGFEFKPIAESIKTTARYFVADKN